ncbi:MAG: FAD-dependent oxidoreductase [Turneriella sp.]|nr:FAD-dependent oxidoreductase [Turneriella sp.]
MARGHALRTSYQPSTQRVANHHRVAIVGGGVSGLSAAWYLLRRGMRDFVLLELENRCGGNAQWGETARGRFPWGAHYLPTPGKDAYWVRVLLEEMGILKAGQYDPESWLHEEQERLFIYGGWQSGLLPLWAAPQREKDQFARFFAKMERFAQSRGYDGRPAFTIPLALSSRDPQFTRFDQIPAKSLLQEWGFDSPRLLWYIDYVLRDEYGGNSQNCSAWALLHYFAARHDAHNLVWPEGNGFITEYLRRKALPHIHEATAARRITKNGRRYHIWCTQWPSENELVLESDVIIFAAPKFVLPYLYPELPTPKQKACRSMVYSPWLTVNLVVDDFATENPAWDNVIFGSRSLGYVVAEHQKAGQLPQARTLTFFHAFDSDDTVRSRRQLWQMDEDAALSLALRELSQPHPGIATNIRWAAAYRWAHAMVRPVPGAITGMAAKLLENIDSGFYSAHSDLSGMSNFEEAQYRGIAAAQRALGEYAT